MIYADNGATTKLSATSLAAMLPDLTEHYGTPPSMHSTGQDAAEALERARQTVAGTRQRSDTHISSGR